LFDLNIWWNLNILRDILKGSEQCNLFLFSPARVFQGLCILALKVLDLRLRIAAVSFLSSNRNQACFTKMTGCGFQEVVNEIIPHQFFEKRRCPYLTTPPPTLHYYSLAQGNLRDQRLPFQICNKKGRA